ncbi:MULTISPECIES: hypothetical protein [unclassified Mesorhizobium]|uniref:hypothetical protein n=1 Tax=unclassified Mesorhizobium TaxID=325217 RepID=UPI00109373A1|nr:MULTISPECIES: hypothetical protein [unclassified Mesorhizobium]TGT35909.1 hypothetical protein EN808_30635 [Mesorhizobium sp. M8A.F.Ca.ET.165.01.1.1]TIS47402.1 MAG: hypothetical protein E5W96_22780 [Mesorhizobium sp.]
MPNERNWLNGYYQFANRLAVLNFLHEQQVAARLLFIYFIGDKGDARRSCPASEAEWKAPLLRQKQHLGLPSDHPLHDRVHSIFLQVDNRLAAAAIFEN